MSANECRMIVYAIVWSGLTVALSVFAVFAAVLAGLGQFFCLVVVIVWLVVAVQLRLTLKQSKRDE